MSEEKKKSDSEGIFKLDDERSKKKTPKKKPAKKAEPKKPEVKLDTHKNYVVTTYEYQLKHGDVVRFQFRVVDSYKYRISEDGLAVDSGVRVEHGCWVLQPRDCAVSIGIDSTTAGIMVKDHKPKYIQTKGQEPVVRE